MVLEAANRPMPVPSRVVEQTKTALSGIIVVMTLAYRPVIAVSRVILLPSIPLVVPSGMLNGFSIALRCSFTFPKKGFTPVKCSTCPMHCPSIAVAGTGMALLHRCQRGQSTA